MHTDTFLDQLDDEQREVATTFGVPVVVLAGAGTGKTRAMTHRIGHGVATGQMDRHGVLAVTFTTRAAGELRGRLQRMGIPDVQARTFHSAALRQAQYFWPRAHGTSLPEVTDRRMGLVAEAARRAGTRLDSAALKDVVGAIGWAKVSNVNPDTYARLAGPGRVSSVEADDVAGIYSAYEALKRERQVIDFDDILLCAASLLAEDDEVAAQVRARYRHFVVDEYQDVSPLQEALLGLWLGERRDICVVGDPAQTIHSFAGARADYLTGFARRHEGSAVITLRRNYRSTSEILSLANRVMRGARHAVTLMGQRGAGEAPTVAALPNEADECDAVVAWLQKLNGRGTQWGEMAVLFRINAQSPPLEAALSGAGVPYTVRGAERFYDRPEVRQAMLALRQAAATGQGEKTGIETIRDALAGVGWSAQAPSGAGAQRERWESWQALADLAEDISEGHPQAAAIVAELEQRAADQDAPSANGVTLATLHSAKGLEWDAVALVGLHDGMMPISMAEGPQELAEEQRLLYVGVTRARQHLHLSWARGRTGAGGNRKPSRYLADVEGMQPARAGRRVECRVCGEPVSSRTEKRNRRHDGCEPTVDEALWEALREWRAATARQASLPAYCVVTDATLAAIAEERPTSRAAMLRISGIGAAKADKYTDGVVSIVEKFQ